MTDKTPTAGSPGKRAADRQILALAVPAFGALVSEPLFLLADSAIVGRLGTIPLAGLGVAGAVLSSIAGAFVFLAYGTTANVARRLGAGDRPGSLHLGLDATWLAAGLGAVAATATWALADPLAELFGAGPAVDEAAATYLRWAAPGLPAMFLVMATSGVLRGLHDTRTTLAVASSGAVVNAGLNLLLVHGIGLGIAGSALGTTVTQVGMAAVMAGVVVAAARRYGVPLAPRTHGVRAAARTGVPLLIRTLSLRAVLVVTTGVAAALGPAQLAAHQVASNVWTFLALTLDALAIAAQALTGSALGAGDLEATRAATTRMLQWGVGGGVLLAALLLAGRAVLPPLFSSDPQVHSALAAVLVVAALMQPLAGYVFVLDGVLIGAGDGRYLAGAGVVQTLAYVPIALGIGRFGPDGTAGLVLLWIAFAGAWMVSRAVLLGRRAHGTAWMVTGAHLP